MFDYWKKKCLVQVKQLDDSLAQEMQVASSPEEWRLRGINVSTIYYAIDFDSLLLKHILLQLWMKQIMVKESDRSFLFVS